MMRAFGVFAAGWWRGPTARNALLLTALLAALVLVNIGANLAVNRWNRLFFDALENRDGGALGWLALVFGGLVVGVAGVGVLIVLTRETLQVRWRAWLVGRLLDLWTARHRYHRLPLARLEPANPEYRIAEDARLATEPVVDFAIGLLNALITALAFIGILWSVGGSLQVTVLGASVTIPAYMTLAALAYGVVVSWLMLRVGKPLVAGVAAKNEVEARLRFEITRLRENAESVALTGGERRERAMLDGTYVTLVARWLAVVRLHGRLTWITNASGALVPVVPLMLATPKFLSGELSLGAVTQLAAAFVQVQVAVAWLVDNYRAVAQWTASARRVMAIVDAVEELEASSQDAIAIEESPRDRLEMFALGVSEPSGRSLVADVRLVLEPGEKILIMGESGVGKSTLMRALAGLWPWGRGRIFRPAGRSAMFVPQRSYLPLGSLRDALLYPDLPPMADDRLRAELEACGLGALASRLDEVERWDQVLSSGERQRLAFARLFLARPGLAVMDEATSALDEAGQSMLMARLRSELPDAMVVTIGHRPGLESFHDRVARLERGDDGVARLIEDRPARIVRAAS